MKTRKLTQTLTLLCALSVCFARRLGISASVYLLAYFTALNVLAATGDNLYVTTTGTTTASGTSYLSDGATRAPLEINGAAGGVVFSGTNLNVTATANSGNGRLGLYVYSNGTAYVNGGTISATGSSSDSYVDAVRVNTGGAIHLSNLSIVNTANAGLNGIGVNLNTGARGTLEQVQITTGNGYGILLDGTSQLTASNVQVQADNFHAINVNHDSQFTGTGLDVIVNGNSLCGIIVDNQATATVADSTIVTTGSSSRGVYVAHQSTGTVTDSTISTFGNNNHALYVSSTSTLFVTGGTVTTAGSGAYGIWLSSQASATVSSVTIETSGTNGRGIHVESSEVSVNDVDITTTGDLAIGIGINGSIDVGDSSLSGSNVTIHTSGSSAHGLSAGGGNTVELRLYDSTVETAGVDAHGLIFSINGTSAEKRREVELVNVSINAQQGTGITTSGVLGTGTIVSSAEVNFAVMLDHSNVSGTQAIYVDKYTFALTSTSSQLYGDVEVTTGTTGTTAVTLDLTQGSTLEGNIIVSGSSETTVNLTDSTITGDLLASGSSTLAVTVGDSGTITGNLTTSDDNTTTVTISDGGIINGDLTSTGNSALGVTVSDNGIINGNITASDNSSLNLDINEDGTVIGNITGSGSSTLDVTVSDGGTLAGNITTSEDTTTTITISDSGTITGDLTASGNSDLTLDLSENGTVIGSITGTGSSTLDITVSDSGTITGNLTTSEDNTTTVTISDGGAINGDLTGSDNSTLAVTVGDNGTLTGALNGDQVTVTVNTGGNVTINQDSDFNSLDNHGNVTVDTGSVIITNPITGNGTTTINDSGNLTASFDGGNGSLVINPGGGVNLTQDSNLGTINNDGTLNVGDYQVSVSDLANNGTIAIAVNTDSGAHGTLHVTGTSSGAGTIHVTSTGDGQANPNDILGNLVTGNGTANYTWDEVDWGLEELIVTPNPDGTITVKEDGTSPAGAVLNSAIAVQQSLWFAQQNSLLKRMGELRYGARASRPQADKDVRVPYNLIENIWIRSYGQQLNVGSQVAGKAYEQLIYGVDLGTDHKFTISADSDLYLGVYAGYGRSDLDYRTPGADGEINSYYGGLYATWLHASGFYIDATFKAASVNNDLKAPYGNTQLKANYSDVNLGGSLELGKKFTFSDAWFIEPQFQVNYLHILAEDYTAGHMNLKAQDLDALQLRIGSLFGRTINLTNSGALQPYVKISGVETISSGGTLRNGYQHTRANTDGARAELGAGLIWQLDTNNQLHLDYEASFGDKYDKPWGLTAGYRHQF